MSCTRNCIATPYRRRPSERLELNRRALSQWFYHERMLSRDVVSKNAMRQSRPGDADCATALATRRNAPRRTMRTANSCLHELAGRHCRKHRRTSARSPQHSRRVGDYRGAAAQSTEEDARPTAVPVSCLAAARTVLRPAGALQTADTRARRTQIARAVTARPRRDAARPPPKRASEQGRPSPRPGSVVRCPSPPEQRPRGSEAAWRTLGRQQRSHSQARASAATSRRSRRSP